MAMRRFVSVGPALVVLFSGALLLVAGPGIVRRLWAAKTAATIEESRRVLAADDFLSRLDQANRLVAQSVTPSVVHVEVTLEANPGTFERDRFRGYRAAGVTRLSVGVQSFNDAHLKALGRVHDRAQAVFGTPYEVESPARGELSFTFSCDPDDGFPGCRDDVRAVRWRL